MAGANGKLPTFTDGKPMPAPMAADAVRAQRLIDEVIESKSPNRLASTIGMLACSASNWDTYAFALAILHDLADATVRDRLHHCVQQTISNLENRQKRLEIVLAMIEFYADLGQTGASEVLLEKGYSDERIVARASEIANSRKSGSNTPGAGRFAG